MGEPVTAASQPRWNRVEQCLGKSCGEGVGRRPFRLAMRSWESCLNSVGLRVLPVEHRGLRDKQCDLSDASSCGAWGKVSIPVGMSVRSQRGETESTVHA